MNNLIFVSIISLFMFFFVHSFFNMYKENFDKQNNIILIGDSILENSNYVEKYFSVESSIKKKHYNVINLAQDKRQVYKEALRVLKPGGRIAISDVLATDELPDRLKNEKALAC